MVYDPFMGRGTTLVEAALLDRAVAGCDVNPLSRVLTKPRLAPPTLEQVSERLHLLDLTSCDRAPEDLTVFYHPETLNTICALRAYLRTRHAAGAMDEVDAWIEMVAVNRLTGHSSGFFSVYTLPPNQAVSVASQRKINARREQTPTARDVVQLIINKSKSPAQGLWGRHETTAQRARCADSTPGTRVQPHPRDSIVVGQSRRHIPPLPGRRRLRDRQLATLLVLWHRGRLGADHDDSKPRYMAVGDDRRPGGAATSAGARWARGFRGR